MKSCILFLIATISVFPSTFSLQFIQVGHITPTNSPDQWPPVTEVFDTDDETLCLAEQSFFDFTANEDDQAGVVANMICETIFDKGICCNGLFGVLSTGGGRTRDFINPTCGYLEGSGWTAIESMPERLKGAASVALHNKRLLLVSGGTNIVREYSNKMYALNESLNWNELEGVTMPRNRWRHCMVQINEEEVAIMGGKDDDSNVIPEVDIYNFQTDSWSLGPELPGTVTRSEDCGCANLWDEQYVIYASADSNPENKLYKWNLASGNPAWEEEATARQTRPFFRHLDNSTVVTSARGSNQIWSFSLANGYTRYSGITTSLRHTQGGSLALPAGTVTCAT